MSLLLVIRLRGVPDRRPEEEKALELLRLHKPFHAVLVRDTPEVRGMLDGTLGSVVTYGEIDKSTLAELLRKRGRLTGNRPLTEDYLKSLGFSSFEDLADALLTGKVSLEDIPELKPVFRLRPPSKGFRGTLRKNIGAGGECGYRGLGINELARRMI